MKVGIVLVNFNGHYDTIECIESVLNSTYNDFQLFVIDNSRDSNSLNFIASYLAGNTMPQYDSPFLNIAHPLNPKPIDYKFMSQAELERLTKCPNEKIILVRSERNLGFAAANNLAMKAGLKSNFSHFWLLNNDTVVERNALKELLSFQLQNPNIGIIGSKLLFYNSPEILQGVGGKYNKWIGKVSEVGYGIPENKFKSEGITIDYPIGASMFTSKEFLEDVGLMDEDYFLYYEEMDWALRARIKGWKIGFCINSKVFHKGGASINKDVSKGNSQLSDFYACRNRILLARKFFPYTLITLYPSFLKFIYNRILLKQYDRILLLFKVLFNPKPHFKE